MCITKIADGELELLPLPGLKSAIWGFFRFLADGQFIEKKERMEVICKKCKR